MSLTYTQITGTFEDGQGNPLSGSATFTPNTTVYAAGIPVLQPDVPIVAQIAAGQLLNASGGTLQLLATDNSGLTFDGQTGFVFWTVAVTVSGQVLDPWSFFLPSSPSVADLWSLANTGAGGGGSGGFANPMTTLGDLIDGGASGTAQRLAGNTSATRKFLRSAGTGSAATAPAWDTLQAGDIPSLAYVPVSSVGAASGVASLDSGSHVPAAQLPAATSGAQGAVELTGDLGGTATSPQVTGTHLASPLPLAQGGTGQNAANAAALLAAVGAAALAGAAFSGEVTVQAPVNPSDAATKAYVDSVAAGLDAKPSAKVVATSNLTLSGAQTIDGVACSAGDRVLATGQSTASQNGLWVVASGAWTRPGDFASGSSQFGAFVFIEGGTAGASSGWVLVGTAAVVVDTGSQTWTQFSGAGEITAGTGLTKAGNTIGLSSPVSPANGGTGQSSLQAAINALAGAVTSGQVLRGNGTNVVLAAIQAGDLPAAVALLTGIVMTGYLAPAVVALADAATIAVNAASGNDFRVTLGGNRTMGAPSNPKDGQKITFELIQDGTGSRTVTWTSGAGGYTFGSGTAPVLSTAAGAIDQAAFRYSTAKGAWLYLGTSGGF